MPWHREWGRDREYLYRDAENCKVWNEAVLKGCLTDEQISQIYQSLDFSLYFVPHLVGLPEERFEKWDPESDHPYFELDEGWIRTVDRPATVNLTPDEITANFQKCKGKWDIFLYGIS